MPSFKLVSRFAHTAYFFELIRCTIIELINDAPTNFRKYVKLDTNSIKCVQSFFIKRLKLR